MTANRIVFMGSPYFAVPTLQRLIESYSVVGVVTQPDRPAGRGQVMTSPPIKILAAESGIETIQPERVNSLPVMEKLKNWNPDLIVVAAYGHILRQNILDLPCFGCVNIHASALPRWRGAAPVQASLLAGDQETGVSIMLMDAGVDTGGILAQLRVAIDLTDNADSLTTRLSVLGAQLLIQSLPIYLDGNLRSLPQEEKLATRSLMIKKEDGILDIRMSCNELFNRIRAYNPWPGASYRYGENIMKIFSTSYQLDKSAEAGQHNILNGLPAVGTCDGWLVLQDVQPANKKRMTGTAFLSGARDWLEQGK